MTPQVWVAVCPQVRNSDTVPVPVSPVTVTPRYVPVPVLHPICKEDVVRSNKTGRKNLPKAQDAFATRLEPRLCPQLVARVVVSVKESISRHNKKERQTYLGHKRPKLFVPCLFSSLPFSPPYRAHR